MLTHATDAGRERLGEQHVAEQFPSIGAQLVCGCVLVAAVEVAEEVASVSAVEREQGRRLAEGAQGEAGALVGRHAPRRKPRERLDHVGRDQRVLEIEDGQVPVGRQHCLPSPLGAARARPRPRCRAHPRMGHNRREMDVLHVLRPVNCRRVEGEGAPVVVVE